MDRRRFLRARVVRLIEERKREKVAVVADELGYSYHYFKYGILPSLLARVECLGLDKEADELVWLCDGDSGEG